MMSFVLAFFLLIMPSSVVSRQDSLVLMFWNLENFFDWKNEGNGKSDEDFSSYGSRRWTVSRFYKKCDVAAKSLLWISDYCGKIPDVVGLCEVENRGVLYKWLNATALRKYGYNIVHFDSGDRRGIDVALLYRQSSFRFLSYSRHVPEYEGVRMSTRDILEVSLESVSDGVVYHFIVNHHPSKFGGGKTSDSRRYAAMSTLKTMCDSIILSSDNPNIIAMGDFNDNPDGGQFAIISDILENKSLSLHQEGKGTIRFQGKWDLIDMFLVNKEIAEKSNMYIMNIPFLMVWDNTYPGFKPLRTYSGPRYVGGVSDHCPIVLTVSTQ